MTRSDNTVKGDAPIATPLTEKATFSGPLGVSLTRRTLPRPALMRHPPHHSSLGSDGSDVSKIIFMRARSL